MQALLKYRSGNQVEIDCVVVTTFGSLGAAGRQGSNELPVNAGGTKADVKLVVRF
jgi:hypothetical protein